MAHQSAYERVPPGAGAYALSAAIISFSLGYLAGQGRAIGLFGGSAARKIATSEKSKTAGTDDDDDSSDVSASEDDEASDLGELQSFAGNTEECKLVLVVRSDLGMTKAAQCGHATLACYKTFLQADPNHKILKQWESLGQAKVALKVDSEDEMLMLQAQAVSLGLCAKLIHDAGRTQIASGSATVLGIGPAPKSKIDQVTGHLKLL
ncbi:putative peptidyl-tRNA hydrolase 2 [Pseudocercospora fuligena]|uniref:peptidyl-tRNA hydrolase n=1 Tax=Pseudocercospora fuligena TaxID=685502 RepID=A0A8H6RHG7_9PEZI|nr:putative peptidyl-tRNA hydrolase 2 [Pseudocercospora fuligena]